LAEGDLIYLSHADILRCALGADEITGAVEEAFRAKARDRAATSRRLNLAAGPQASFTAKAGLLLDEGYAAVKWYGFIGDNARRGLPDFNPLIILSSRETGLPLAVLDGRWITAVRTASITAAAAAALAKPDSRSVGFVACGAQAEAHLAALRARFPLRRVVAYSRNRATAERFAGLAREQGLAAEAAADPRDAVGGLDIVVTSVPKFSEPTRFLSGHDVSDGAFVSMVDMGFGWDAATLDAFETVVTDDLEKGERRSAETLNYEGEFAADLGGLLAGEGASTVSQSGRRALIFAGSGLADVAAAVRVYRRALSAGLGLRLPYRGEAWRGS
jgi:ornithine cyclodeaminase/alanine dehydrogenase-like protein (mu-crystallin family)